MEDRTCEECRHRFFETDYMAWICTNTFSKYCGGRADKYDIACDCYEKKISWDDILEEEK